MVEAPRTTVLVGELGEHSSLVEALYWLRVLQPAVLLLVLLLSVVLGPSRRFFGSAFRRDRYAQLTFNDEEAPEAGSALADQDETPQPTPVIVPVRSRRRLLTQYALLGLATTYLSSGVLIVLRAVLPNYSDPGHQHVWTPDLLLWRGSHLQAVGGTLAWAGIALALLLEERSRGMKGSYGRGKAAWSILFGMAVDIAVFVLYFVIKGGGRMLPDTNAWTIVQLCIIVSRFILLYPALFIALCWDQVKFVRATEIASQQSGQQNVDPSERNSLLNPRSAALTTNYGAAGPSSSASSADSTKNGSSKPNDGRTAGQTDLGLSVAATPPPPTLRVFIQRVTKLFPYLWPSKSPRLQALALLCAVVLLIARFVNLLVPLTLGAIVEDLGMGVAPWWHIGLFTLLKLFQGGSGFLRFVQSQAWIPVMQYSDRMMSMMAFEHLLNLSMAFHTKRKTGEVLRILDRGAAINNLFEYLFFQLVPIFIDLLVAITYLTRAFSWRIGLTLFIIMYAYVWVSVKLTAWRTDLRRRMNNLDSVSRALHTDVLLNWESVKCFGNEEFEAGRYRDSLIEYQKAAYQVQASLNVLNLTQNTIICVGTLITTLMVASSVVRGQTTPSQFVVFITYLQQVYSPLNMLGTLYRVVQQNFIDTDKLMGLLDEQAEIKDEPDAKELVVTEGVIEFRDVHFAYESGKVQALRGLNMMLDAKSACAVVGESGAGKSTILRLLLRFYAPQSGTIYIDGQDISKVTQKSLRKAIGIVPQDSSLFNSSIRTNILYGRVDATDEELEQAAKAAQIWDKIQSFPDGMNTVVGERGVRLSGGERQRMAIARAFLRGSPLLLLDEASSSLDSATERSLQEALKTLLQGRTSLTIAHRLSTIINSDVINVISNGRLVESGTHEELIVKEEGTYRQLWLKQVQTQKEAEAAAAAAAQVKAEAELEPLTSNPTSPKSPFAAAAVQEAQAASSRSKVLKSLSPPMDLASGTVPPAQVNDVSNDFPAPKGTSARNDGPVSRGRRSEDLKEDTIKAVTSPAPAPVGQSKGSSADSVAFPRTLEEAAGKKHPNSQFVDGQPAPSGAEVDLERGNTSVDIQSSISTRSFRKRISSLIKGQPHSVQDASNSGSVGDHPGHSSQGTLDSSAPTGSTFTAGRGASSRRKNDKRKGKGKSKR
ncbi:hypothetical protein K437DRAFT_230882 [Tilletiaria anomala UBC 951]|uniref:P-loop containing nucleoside triphosphate hydrolase protein n=1 Tax=Tilletiaria anomala (strain ATCC 24038 / CBS 436.72 / UBC 951) TaxID=1037660 RepID=A0A066WKY1_TILAU|nr:uncharacterized protein K437DRAFT_230882 [Tilletiaria anomala UBC 951]KDN53233.1 hypothetical protein K437DRAFT_230882 [Tilletiaria anomala UBC 951]